jgi:hypothetical protein
MTQALTQPLANTLAPLGALFGEIAGTPYFNEVSVAAAVLLTVVGTAMHWHLPRHRMSMEERVKDGKMTVTTARRRVLLYKLGAPFATVLGMAVLAAVLLGLE